MKKIILSCLLLSAFILTACSDDNFAGDAPKDWNGTISLFSPTEDAAYSTYFKPEIGRVGDPMPFYDQNAGEFKVLYLQEFNNNDPYCFHPFYGVRTKDGVNYQPMGEVLATGKSRYEADAALGTGCAVYNEADGLYYIYYTGHTSKEVVMRATSPDFKTWTKDLSWVLKGTDNGCSDIDFRDPQIFQTADKVYHMLISTRPAKGGNPLFAEYTSQNMKDWSFAGTFNMLWERMYECPDVFQMGNYWYLVYSDSNKQNWGRSVKYMMAKSWEELKAKFADGGTVDREQKQLDSRAFYAGKTASNGTDRFIWGWTPFRSGVTNDEKNVNVGGGGEPNWSGALVCHKLVQHEDGTLSVGVVPGMADKYNKQTEVKVMNQDNNHTLYSRLGTHNHISFTVKTADKGQRFGVSFARGTVTRIEKDEDGKDIIITEEVRKFYSLVFNPEWDDQSRRKINFEQEGVEGKGFIEGGDGYVFLRPADNVYNIDIFTDNSVVTVYVNNEYGYTQRIYGIQKNCWSINSYGNPIEVSNVKVSQY